MPADLMSGAALPSRVPVGVPALHRSQSAAVALLYQEHGGAPRVGAKGRGLIADEIIRRARAAGICVHESREMVSLLMQVDLDQHIPPQLYTAVAELLSWIYRIEGRTIAGASPPKKPVQPEQPS
jgi:flagellar biosynthesis protein